MNLSKKIRCINIDWLEVYCNEGDVCKDAAYFRGKGYEVKTRDYGTPQYKQMFTVMENDLPLIEIRRDPYSLRSDGGIFFAGDCHLRLPNRQCYELEPINDLRTFLLAHGYTYKSISRIDICLDFQHFDSGQTPDAFIKSFMAVEISKLNQCNIAVHGRDLWANRLWNSLKWGSEKSPITTKLYNKSLEMKQTKVKNYIRDQWERAGLTLAKDVWRIEFSVKSHIKGYVHLETGEIIHSTLNEYDSRAKCLFMFHVLLSRYFDFRKVERSRTGALKRKNRCTRIETFSFADGSAYKPIRLQQSQDPTRTDRLLIKRLYEILKNEHYNEREKITARDMISIIASHMRLNQDEDTLTMKQEIIRPRMTDKQFEEYMKLVREITTQRQLQNCPF